MSTDATREPCATEPEPTDPQPASERRFRAIFEQAAVAIGVLSTKTGRILRVNKKYEELVGYTERELTELDFMRLTYPEDLAEDLAEMERLKRGDTREFSLEKRLLRKDGTPVWVKLTVSAMSPPGAEVEEHIAVLEDIGARRDAQRETQEALAALESTLAALPDLLFDVDDEGRIHDVRAPVPELLLAPAAELLGKRLEEYLPREAFVVIDPALREAFATGRTTRARYRLELAGREHWFDVSIARKKGGRGQPRAIAIARDVTDEVVSDARRAALEAQLRQAQKMEAVGTLAGGIAHDFNNMLAAIGLSTELAKRSLPIDHAAADALGDVELAVRRATKLVQQILAFSRKQPALRGLCSLDDAVLEATRLLRATLPAGVSLEVSLGGLPAVLADPTQLQQVLVNLGTNAWQAMPQGTGTITFSTRLVRIVEGGHPTLAPGSYGVVRVADDGDGMSPEVRERAFEPFFTTKEPGQGSGLGLSVVHGIVRDHGGWIDLISEPGVGTSFDVYFAATASDAPGDSPEPPPSAESPAGGGARVLCVDDEPSLLSALASLLTRLGYRATAIADPREALARIRADPDAYDALLTDLSMPGLSGIELARAVSAIRPTLPVVLMSGFAPQDAELLAAAGIREPLAKPVQLASLTEVLLGLGLPRSAPRGG